MRLIKLAMLGLFGYVTYEFIRGMLQGTQLGNRVNDAWGKLMEEDEGSPSRGASQRAFGGGTNMTGPGHGTEVDTLDSDGGSVRHKVGRGVVS